MFRRMIEYFRWPEAHLWDVTGQTDTVHAGLRLLLGSEYEEGRIETVWAALSNPRVYRARLVDGGIWYVTRISGTSGFVVVGRKMVYVIHPTLPGSAFKHRLMSERELIAIMGSLALRRTTRE